MSKYKMLDNDIVKGYLSDLQKSKNESDFQNASYVFLKAFIDKEKQSEENNRKQSKKSQKKISRSNLK